MFLAKSMVSLEAAGFVSATPFLKVVCLIMELEPYGAPSFLEKATLHPRTE
jgi:hypothetical protein